MAQDAHHTPGEPPPIRDEAAESPLWLPAVGLTLLLLGAIFIVWRSATAEEAEDAPVEQAEETTAQADEPAGGDADEADAPE